MLSSIDETIIQHDKSFNIGIHQYKDDLFDPKGHKYLHDFNADKLPITTLRIGGVVLTRERGYDFKEDLFVPGYFELAIKKGESVILSACTKLINPSGLKQKFNRESKSRNPRSSFKNCLINSAKQFFINHKNEVNIIAEL